MAVAESATDLKLEAPLGLNGTVPHGLQYTPDGKFIAYPLGTMIIVRSLTNDSLSFLEGHNNIISTLTVSRDGKRLASGEVNLAAGIKVEVIIWDLERARKNAEDTKHAAGECLLTRLRAHSGKVQDLAFSADGTLLATLGGQDDNTVLIWKLDESKAVGKAPGGSDQTLCVQWLNNRSDRFVTGGYFSLRVWQIDISVPRLHHMEARVGTLRRMYQCISISKDDKYAYCGTKTGDLVRVRIDRDDIPRSCNEPDKVRPTFDGISKRLSMGICSCATFVNPATGNTNILVGAGDGTVTIINPKMGIVPSRTAQLTGAVTSISVSPDGKGFLAATDQSNRYYLTFDFALELRGSCHYGPINSVIFPYECSELFLTCSTNDIRVWNTALRQELLRIQVPNLEAKAIAITRNGGTILSGWTDGKIRAFLPESGKLKFIISNAHKEGVTALAVCNEDENRPPWRIVSGGEDGQVRVWHVTSTYQSMAFSAKDHRDAVACIKITADNAQAVSASADGSCIIWDLQKKVRLAAFLELNNYKAVLYHPEESQILTAGTNRKIAYWDAYDGSPIRMLEGGMDSVNSLDITADGKYFVSGGADQQVKVWDYDDGLITGIGRGHGGAITSVKFAPNGQHVVSVGREGEVFIWRVCKGIGMEPSTAEKPTEAEQRVPAAS